MRQADGVRRVAVQARSTQRGPRALLASAMVVVALAVASLAPRAEGPSEYELKAAFLLHFLSLTEWPREAFAPPDRPYTVCVLGSESIEATVRRVIEGKRVGDREVQVRKLEAARNAPGCHLVFVTRARNEEFGELHARLAHHPTLLVAETAGLAARGAILNFYRDGARIRFEANRAAAHRAGLRLSSRLLRLARLVGSKGE